MVAQSVLCTILGELWFQEHVTSKHPPTNFFRNKRQNEQDITVGGLRVIHLAEMMWNLRNIKGMDSCVRFIFSGKAADGFAEFEVGKLLYVFGKTFKTVEPTGVLGADYDLEIEFDGIIACANTKCKLETTAISNNTILNSLQQARKQLPSDRPGIIFVSIPQNWHDTDKDGFGRRLFDVTKIFLRGTKRIVSVKYHTSLIVDSVNEVSATLGLLEVSNDKHKFNRKIAWNFYRDLHEMPESWVSIVKECSDEI